jgi:hypothetical protein
VRGPGGGVGDREPEFREFFAGQYGRLYWLGYLLTGDRAKAEDLAQEALVRAWWTWARVRTLDRPEAYVRKVLVNRHRSLLRRALLEARHARRTRPEEGYLPAGGPYHGLGAGAGAQLGQDVGNVVADGLEAEREVIGDVGVAVTLGHQLQDLAFPLGQLRKGEGPLTRPPVARCRLIRSTTLPESSPSPWATVWTARTISSVVADFST